MSTSLVEFPNVSGRSWGAVEMMGLGIRSDDHGVIDWWFGFVATCGVCGSNSSLGTAALTAINTCW